MLTDVIRDAEGTVERRCLEGATHEIFAMNAVIETADEASNTRSSGSGAIVNG